MIPPRKVMSEPARSGTYRSASALVRVNRGSTWITVALGHVRALDQDAVSVLQVLLESGRAAAAKARPQTGDGGGVSNTGLVLDLDRAERREQLLDQVVLFVVERGAAEAREAQRPAGARAVGLPLPPPPAGVDHPVGDHVHGRAEVEGLPLRAERPAVQHLVPAALARGELEARRSLGAQAAPADRRVGVAFDLGDPPAGHVHVLAAADRAVRADRRDHGVGRLGPGGEPAAGPAFRRLPAPQPVGTGYLPVYRP